MAQTLNADLHRRRRRRLKTKKLKKKLDVVEDAGKKRRLVDKLSKVNPFLKLS